MKILFFLLITFLIGSVVSIDFTDRELFEIELLDPEKNREALITKVFGNKGKIGIERLKLLAFKALLNEEYDHIATLQKGHEEGKDLSKNDEEVLVNVFIVDLYLKKIFKGEKGKNEFDKKDVEKVLDKKNFFDFSHLNAGEIMEKARDEVMKHPIAIDMEDFNFIEDDFDDL